MRIVVLMFPLAFAASACAQHPETWSYPSSSPPPPSGEARSPIDSVAISEAMLQAHNDIRSQVGMPPLIWSDQLASVAEDWAYHLVATDTFQHRPHNQFGENLYMISGGSASPSDVVAAWAKEARQYDIRSNTCTGVCGHYTQIVWADTRRVGCAVAADQSREVWVCDYDPPGNYLGFRPY
jgi:pathogenesis-related protein 1